MTGKKWILAVIVAGALAACCLAGLTSFAKTADQAYPGDAENGVNVSGGGDAAADWLPRETSDGTAQGYLEGTSNASQGGPKAREARTSKKTAAPASAEDAGNPALASMKWRRAFGPLLSRWMWLVPGALAIAAIAWITSLVARRRSSSRGAPPLVVFGADGPAVAPARRRDERPRRAA